MAASRPEPIHLRAGGVSLVLDVGGPRLPSVLHWGGDLGDVTPAQLRELALAAVPAVVSSGLDTPAELSVLAEHATGWPGLPGLRGHRGGTAWSPLFTVTSAHAAGAEVRVEAVDEAAGLELAVWIALDATGLITLRAAVRNRHPAEPYVLDGLVLNLPVPAEAAELLDLTGRHLRERSPQRQPFTVGSRVRESRRGRTGADASLLLAAGVPDFGFRSGEVWAVHVGWSGNHVTYAERLPDGRAVIGGGELLLPGEVRLEPGEEYTTPRLYAAYGHGLDGVSDRFHRHLRARPGHPADPRPVVMNTWEAVYFDHDLPKLRALADRAAEVGAERFVLDDGWFRHRRDDYAGLGDWYVDEDVWPQGLHPLVDHVRALGLGFGLWVEPEMINPDSDLARAHPEWIMSTGGRTPPEVRHQQVLDLVHPEAYAYVLDRLDRLVAEYAIDYLKWDHNRDLIDAGHSPRGEAAVHRQTLAVYRLLDELRRRHPGLEIESCSSGGARVDLGILQRTDRVWGSDCIDALERQSIQRWTQLLLPPELIGSHVGAGHAHTTGRRHDLAFRAGTALFGHFGIEWDLTSASVAERAELARWIALYKDVRGLLHTGRIVRADHPDPALWVHGVVAQDRSEAIFALVAVATSVVAPPGRVRLPGLDPRATYRVEPLAPGDVAAGINHVLPSWLARGELRLPGSVLEQAGIQAPDLYPEHLLLLRLTRE
ncbi:alpha-galactosidase [Nonomuraea turcica]|uniref:alpha-galactosidase n=1 Tax=Nonomuraea sp. G32 TaxID=3067274 RepID=UPI00273B4009|nr:alpha-galactosidase [Nonomuraea sp. G32]MDP4502574.1 alpha-galactosidase [Nonomuraea sp. G32]